MKSNIIFGLFALLIGSLVYPALGQTESIANHVVINEIEINPPGDDSKSISEWIELYNPTNSPVDIGGWSIASTTLLKKTLAIPAGTIIKPDSYLLFNHGPLWFPDAGEVVELRDKAGNVIDKTPRITDLKNDFTTWQRIYDGYNTGSDADWKFEFGTPGRSNGKLQIEEAKTPVTVSVVTDKDGYIFGDVVTIGGKVSEHVYVQKPYFSPSQIKVNVVGPDGFSRTISLFPDQSLSYKTTLVLNQVLGFRGGEYTVTVNYSDASATTSFTLGTKVVQQVEKERGLLHISTEKEAYLPGQFVTIKASTTDIIPLEGLKYQVINPEKATVFSGILYPNSKGEFTGSVFMSPIKPTFGTFRIISEYSTYYAETTFDLAQDIKESKLISLKTDKTSYRPGEKVTITGRLNSGWIPSFDIEILQTGTILSTGADARSTVTQPGSSFKISNVIRLAGDGTFGYEFTIPNSSERLGDYRVIVSKSIGQEQVYFRVTESPEDVIESIEPFTVSTNKQSYDLGETLVVSGKASVQQIRSTFQSTTVSMTIQGPDGKDLMFISCPVKYAASTCDIQTKVVLTAVPNVVGDYRADMAISKELFKPGIHTIKASYDQGKYTTTTTFTVNESIVIGDRDILVSLDKTVYGLGEKVQLTGKVSERFPTKSLSITITKPNGSIERHGVAISNNEFSWSWDVPRSETLAAQAASQRSLASSNYGTYKITVSSDRDATSVLFRVSPAPDEDLIFDQEFVIKTNKVVYNAGEKLEVTGKTTKKPTTIGLAPERVQILVKSPAGKTIFESFVHPDSGGEFKQTFVMPVTVFPDGTYKVTASYSKLFDEKLFTVNNDFKVGGEDRLALEITLDKEEYYPGDIVKASGRTNKLISLKQFEITVIKEDPSRITCGAFYCGAGVPVVKVQPDPAGKFSYEHKIPPSSGSIGTYLLTAKTPFGNISEIFTVVEKPAISEQVMPEEDKALETIPTKKFFDKVNRIPETIIPITVSERILDEQKVQPRTIQGSLVTTMRGSEANVNIQITTQSGICVIGQQAGCLVSESTRAPGTIYQIVELDGINYNIRYSGPDVSIEKFTILPESSSATIPDTTWNVEILKNDEPSRFYYQVLYIPVA